MNTAYGNCSLFLSPAQDDFSTQNLQQLVSALQDTGLISKKINPQVNDFGFFTGDKFLDYIAYMGCSPTIQFDADEDNENFCFIRIHSYESAKLINSKIQASTPQCPNCKKPVKNWQEKQSASVIFCNHCQTSSGINEFNWRKMAGYSRLFIEITDIFPKEAIPQQLLLDKLASITDTNWLYFYSCQ